MRDPLTAESGAALRAVADALKSGHLTLPISRMALSRVTRLQEHAATEIVGLSSAGITSALLARMLDLAAVASEAAPAVQTELVWTGPEGLAAQSRDTAVVAAEMFGAAERSVLVSTFVVRQGAMVFETLAQRMVERPELAVRVFLHVPREMRDTRHDSEILRGYSDHFRRQWPWPQTPQVFYDPRSIVPEAADRATWHAKCVVIDDEQAFVTSANFTEWAQSRNVEAGILVRGGSLPRQLRSQFDGLVQAGAVKRLPGF